MVEKESQEYQYINIIKKIINEGHWEEGRNGRTKSIFGESMRFSLQNGTIPIITVKKTAWKTCLKELLWFIRGETNNKLLQEQGVHIWDGNSTREFVESRGLGHYPEGILGNIYGYQWRFFNASYNYMTGKPIPDENNKTGIDQLQQIIDALKDPKQSVLLICNTQNRSKKVVLDFQSRGYSNVQYVIGGMSEWTKRGWALETPP